MGQDGGIGLPTPVSELVDRETEIGEVLRLLGTSRLTTLTGPGGIGKTRLAIAAAHAARGAEDAAAEFADGAVFVPLAELAAGEDIALAVAAALPRDLANARSTHTSSASWPSSTWPTGCSWRRFWQASRNQEPNTPDRYVVLLTRDHRAIPTVVQVTTHETGGKYRK